MIDREFLDKLSKPVTDKTARPETMFHVGRAEKADWIERNPRFGQRMRIRAKDGKSLRNPTRTKPVRDWYHVEPSFGRKVTA